MKKLLTVMLLFCCLFGFSQTKEQDSLAIALAFQTQDSSKVDTSIALIKSLYNSEDYTKAMQYVNQTERLAAQLQYDEGSAEIYFYKGQIYTSKNDYYNAINSYERSKKLYIKIGDSLGIAKVNNNTGLIEIERGNYRKGLQYSLSAIDIFEAKNLKEELSKAYNNLAKAYHNTGNLEDAIDFNKKALRVRTQLQDSVGIKTSTKNIADLYSERKEHRKAIEYYNQALTLLDDEKDAEMIGNILPNLGEEYLQYREYEQAASILLRGLRLNRKIKSNLGILKSYNGLAQLNFEKGKYRTTGIQLDEALTLTNSVNNDDEKAKTFKYRMRLDSALGKYQNAFYWQNKYYDLQKKIDAKKLPVRNFIDDAPLETISTETMPEVKASNASVTPVNSSVKNKYLVYGLAAAILACLGIIIFMYYRQKDSVDKSKRLEKENKKMSAVNKDILEQSKHLEETNQVKDRLFSIVSHDLKDSVSSIKGCLDLFKEGSISNEEFNNLIPELSDNADNASQLLFDLLNWSKTQMHNLEPNTEAFDIQEVFKSKIHLVEQKLEQKRVVLIDESKSEMVSADRDMIEIVIQNLIANAIKFSRVGDVITLSNRERSGKVLLCIEDTGVGISEENQKRIFSKDAFTTLGTDNEKGTGLGLSICKELIELNNGRIWVKSEENFGSKFFIELPKAK